MKICRRNFISDTAVTCGRYQLFMRAGNNFQLQFYATRVVKVLQVLHVLRIIREQNKVI